MNEIINIALNNISHLDPIALKSLGCGATLLFFSSIAFYKVKKRKQKNNKVKQLQSQLEQVSQDMKTNYSQGFKLNSEKHESSFFYKRKINLDSSSLEPSLAQLLKKNSDLPSFEHQTQLSFDFGEEDIPILHDIVAPSILNKSFSLQTEGNLMNMSTEDLDLFIYNVAIRANEEDKILLSEEKKQLEELKSFAPSISEDPILIKEKNSSASSSNFSALADLGTIIHQECQFTDISEVPAQSLLTHDKKSVWVNWMLVSNGTTMMKRSMLDLLESWGTESAVMQLEDILSQEAQAASPYSEHSWSVLSVFPIEKSI